MALPIPKENESLADYLKNEIRAKVDELYPEFKDKTDDEIIDMLMKDDKYQSVRDHPNFKKMMEEAGSKQKEASQESEGIPTEEIIGEKKEKEKPKEEVEKVDIVKEMEVDDPSKESEEVKATPTEAVTDTVMQSETAAPGRSRMKWKNVTFSIDTKVSTKLSECGLFLIQQDGIREHLHGLSFGDPERRKLLRIVHLLGEFVAPGRIQPIDLRQGSGEGAYFLDPKYHVIDKSDPIIQDMNGATEERLVKRYLDSKQPNNLLTELYGAMLYDHMDMDEFNSCLDLSLVNRSDNGYDAVYSGKYIHSKVALTCMLQRVRAYKFCYPLGNQDFIDDHDEFIHEELKLRYKHDLLLDADVTYATEMKQTRYGRTYLPIDRNNFMLTVPDRERYLYFDMLKKSYQSAKTYFSSVRETRTEHSRVIGGQALMGELMQISPADGATFAQNYFSYLCGGRGHALEIEESMDSPSDVLHPMACYATLLLIPMTMLSPTEVNHLLAGILSPVSTPVDAVQDGRRDPILGNIAMATAITRYDGAGNVTGLADERVIRNVLERNIQGTAFYKVRKAQQREAKQGYVRFMLNVFRAISNTRMHAIEGMPQLFSFEGPNPKTFYLPFGLDENIPNTILFKKHIHSALNYNNAAVYFRDNLASLMYALQYVSAAVESGLSDYLNTYRGNEKLLQTATSLATATLHTILAAQDTNVSPAANAVNRGELRADAVDVATVTPMGALAFLMHGIESDKLHVVRENTSEAYKFVDYQFELPVPDAYGPYLYLERALAVRFYREFRGDMIMLVEKNLLVKACMHVLALWFETLDSGSEARLSMMFQNPTDYLEVGEYRIPDELMINGGAGGAMQINPRIGATAMPVYRVRVANDALAPYAIKVFSQDGNGVLQQEYPIVDNGMVFTEETDETQLEASYMREKHKIKDFIISVSISLKPYVFMDTQRINTILYMVDEEKYMEAMEHDALLPDGADLSDRKVLTYDELMNQLSYYYADNVYSPADIVNMLNIMSKAGNGIAAEFIVVKKAFCDFNFVEEKTGMDTFSTAPDLSIKQDEFLATDIKYVTSGSMPIYYRKAKDNYLRLDVGQVVPGMVNKNINFLPQYGFRISSLMPLVATMGDNDLMDNSTTLFGNQRPFRLLSGNGAELCSDGIVISSREKEDIVIQESLPLYKLLF